jgi:hypothetical protein
MHAHCLNSSHLSGNFADFARRLERERDAARAENAAMREAIREARDVLQLVVLETCKQWDTTQPLPCVGAIEKEAFATLAKLKPFIPDATPPKP